MGRPTERSRSIFRRLLLPLGLGLLLEAGLVGMVLVVFRMPDTFVNIYGYNPSTRALSAAGWGMVLPTSLRVDHFQALFTGLWLALNALWLVAFLVARRLPDSPAVLWSVFGPALLFQVTLVLAMPPSLSTDIYNYLAYGRMVAFHGLNPYTTLPSHMGGDPVLAFPLWDIFSHYGPPWIALSAGIAWISGRAALFPGVLLFKGVAALSHLAVGFLSYRLARSWNEAAGVASAVLLGWSPLLLLEGAGSGHNDLLMMALALAGLLAYRKKKPWWGLFLLLLSVMVKYVSLILLFFYCLAWLREQEGGRARLRLLGMVVGVALLAFALAYAPFWEGPATLLGGITEESSHLILSPAAFLRGPLQALWPALGFPAQRAEGLTFLALNVLQKVSLLAVVLWSARRLWLWAEERLPQVVAAWGSTSLIYVSLLHNAIFPWYFIWPFSTAGVEWYRPTRRWVVWCSGALGVLSVLFYGIPF